MTPARMLLALVAALFLVATATDARERARFQGSEAPEERESRPDYSRATRDEGLESFTSQATCSNCPTECTHLWLAAWGSCQSSWSACVDHEVDQCKLFCPPLLGPGCHYECDGLRSYYAEEAGCNSQLDSCGLSAANGKQTCLAGCSGPVT